MTSIFRGRDSRQGALGHRNLKLSWDSLRTKFHFTIAKGEGRVRGRRNQVPLVPRPGCTPAPARLLCFRTLPPPLPSAGLGVPPQDHLGAQPHPTPPHPTHPFGNLLLQISKCEEVAPGTSPSPSHRTSPVPALTRPLSCYATASECVDEPSVHRITNVSYLDRVPM